MAAVAGYQGILRKRDALNRWISRFVVFHISPEATAAPVLDDGPTPPSSLMLPPPHPATITLYRTETMETVDETIDVDFGQLVFRVEELFPKVRWPAVAGGKGFGLLSPTRENGICFHADAEEYVRWKEVFERFEKLGLSVHVLKMPLLPHSIDLLRSAQYPLYARALRRLHAPAHETPGSEMRTEDDELGSNTDYQFRYPEPTILHARMQPSQQDPRSCATSFVILVNIVRCRGSHRADHTCVTDGCPMMTRLVSHPLGDFYKLRDTLMAQGHLTMAGQTALPKLTQALDPRRINYVISLFINQLSNLFDGRRSKLQDFLTAIDENVASRQDINYRFFILQEARSTPMIHKAIMQMDMGKLTQVLASSMRLTELTTMRETVVHTAVRTSASMQGRLAHAADELPAQDPLLLLLADDYLYRAIILGVITEPNVNGESPLHVAVELNHVLAVKALLKISQARDVVDLHNHKGEAALHIAARHCNRQIIEALVEAGQANVLLLTKYERRTVFNRTARQLVPRHLHLLDAPFIRGYLKECARSYTLKLLMLGSPSSGKTTLINACLNRYLDRRDPLSARGIQVTTLRGHGTHGDLQFWDYPGPEELNAGLEFTLQNQKRCIFVLTLKVADFDVDISSGFLEAQLRFWLKCVTLKTAALRATRETGRTSSTGDLGPAPAPAAAASAAMAGETPGASAGPSPMRAGQASRTSLGIGGVGSGAGARSGVRGAGSPYSPLHSRLRSSSSSVNIHGDLGYRATVADQRARHEGTKAVVVLAFTFRDKFHGAEESNVIDFLTQMVNRAYFQFGQDIEFLVDESFDQGRPYFWLNLTGRTAYTQAASFVRHMQAVTSLVTRAYQRPVTQDCLRGLAWVKLWRQALVEGDMARVRYKPRSYDELKAFILQRNTRDVRRGSKVKVDDATEEEKQIILLEVLSSLRELEEVYWVEQDADGKPLNIHVDVSWLVGASLERLLLLESTLQPNHILNLNALNKAHALPPDVCCFISDLAIEYAFAPERPNLFLLLRDLIALKVVFGFEIPAHALAGGPAHLFTLNESLAPPPDTLDDLPSRYLLVPLLMPSVTATLQKIVRWKEVGVGMGTAAEASAVLVGSVVTPANENAVFAPYVICQLIIYLITHNYGLHFVWREGVQFRISSRGIAFTARYVLPGAEPMAMDSSVHVATSAGGAGGAGGGAMSGTGGSDRRTRIAQAKEMCAAFADRLQYLEVHVIHKHSLSDEFIEGGRDAILVAAREAMQDAIAIAFSVLEHDCRTVRLRTQYLQRWPQEYGRPSLYLDESNRGDEVLLNTSASASLVNEQVAIYRRKEESDNWFNNSGDLLKCAQDCCHLSNLVYQSDLYNVLTVNKMQRLLTKIIWRYDSDYKIPKETIKLVKSPLDSTVMRRKLFHTAGFLVFLRGGTVYVCLRGTNSFNDAMIDSKLRRYSLAEKEGLDRSAAGAEVHMGFYQMAVAIRRAFFDVMGYPSRAYDRIRNLPLVLCGHSLGGATAQLLHGLLQARSPDKDASMWRGPVYTFTFGSPLVGNGRFATWLPQSKRVLNFVLHNDPVPYALLKGLLYFLRYVSGRDQYTPAGMLIMISQFGSLPLVIGTDTEEQQTRARDCLVRSRSLLTMARHRIDVSYQPVLADPETVLWASEVLYRAWRVPRSPSRSISASATPDVAAAALPSLASRLDAAASGGYSTSANGVDGGSRHGGSAAVALAAPAGHRFISDAGDSATFDALVTAVAGASATAPGRSAHPTAPGSATLPVSPNIPLVMVQLATPPERRRGPLVELCEATDEDPNVDLSMTSSASAVRGDHDEPDSEPLTKGVPAAAPVTATATGTAMESSV